MSSWKDVLSKKIIEFFKSLGIDPLLPFIFVMLLLSINKLKHIKKWDTLTIFEKRWDFLFWIILTMLLLIYIAKVTRGD